MTNPDSPTSFPDPSTHLSQLLEEAAKELAVDWSSKSLKEVLSETSPNLFQGGITSEGASALEKDILKPKPYYKRRKKGYNVDGSKRKLREDSKRKKRRDKYYRIEKPTRDQRMKTDPYFRFKESKRLNEGVGAVWLLTLEEYLELMQVPVVDPILHRKCLPLELSCKWMLYRLDRSLPFQKGNVIVNPVGYKGSRTPKGRIRGKKHPKQRRCRSRMKTKVSKKGEVLEQGFVKRYQGRKRKDDSI